MVKPTPVKSTNPNPKKSYHIGGIQVEFPYKPYGTQLAFMGRVISTLDRAQRDGHCHALLESPTGTGKSLSLLCSTLAWQQNYKLKNQYANLTHSTPNPEAITDPLAHGGGFVPESTPSSTEPTAAVELAQKVASNKKKKAVPKIYYASRTHSQISQVVNEFRKTTYRVPMAVLASRKHYCTNVHVNRKENIDEECKLLLKDKEAGCLQFKNANKVRGHPSLQKGGCHEVHDIEDLVKVGQVVKGCSYYAARSMADDAQLVFCPYNYIINPVIRGAMEVDIIGAILVLDEAHNIEDIARDAGSVDVEEDVLQKLQTELQELCPVDPMIYQPLYEMAQDLLSWIERRKNKLEKREFQHYCSCWAGDKALREFQEANISQQCFPILLDCAKQAIKAATDTEAEVSHLSGMSVVLLEGLFSSLTYFFSRNGCQVSDFQLALRRYVKRDGKKAGDWTCTLSLWCLNPAVVFKDIADLSLSVILTSGTLSPMNSFSSELGVQFGTCLEAPHVVDVESQVCVSVISTSPDNYPLNASYKTADCYTFQDALGKSLEEICKIVPAGSLVFFPSYKLMEKLSNRWRETGQWSRLNARKPLFVEPRGGSQEDFDSILKGYYDCIRRDKRPALGRKRKVKKVDANHLDGTESTDNSEKGGASFLAVCRGKVSEGIDFSDDYARIVVLVGLSQIVVGIPFPNINDIQVGLKKKYNDAYKTSKNLLGGNEWYCQQAFRALNQAVGRCIRHKFDYGSIILLDERYKEERNRVYISKWLRKSIQQYNNFDMSLEGLRSFFRNAKEKVGKNMEEFLLNSDANKEKNIPRMDQIVGHTRNKSQKRSNSDQYGEKIVSLTKCEGAVSKLKSQDDVEVQASIQIDDELESSQEIIDLECDSHIGSRCSEASFHEDPEITLVEETPGMGECGAAASPGFFSKDGNSSSTMMQAPNELADQGLVSLVSVTNQSAAPDKSQCSMLVTPEKELTITTCNLRPEVESSLNLSVNSHTQKRRKSMDLSLINLRGEQSDTSYAETPGCVSFTRSSVTSGDTNRRIVFGLETNCRERLSTKHASRLLPNSCATSCASSDSLMDKRLQISCSLCKSPLGRPENNLYVECSLTSSSKVHLASLVKERMERCAKNKSKCVPVLVTDISSVDQRLCNIALQDARQKGVWSEEDGCVFNSVFCPFCSMSNCLGVKIMATDASNVHLLNKILFYTDCLEFQNLEASKDLEPMDKDLSPVTRTAMDKTALLNSLGRFSYSPQPNSGGWRTTKSKLRLPKRDVLSNTQG
ncbi:Fanconi anemia group J protein [Populus alba x Populus x berolinensis]|uniref:DNA 5'-3' helicase FANCJ n=1 Tax=Populus alba x Populus x berolinensis TaxID=444605 RepID=A0AAD6RBE1_9ROSI|nr:Fanconi anemia group J protein [Populus alba x Populus x berolinensis]